VNANRVDTLKTSVPRCSARVPLAAQAVYQGIPLRYPCPKAGSKRMASIMSNDGCCPRGRQAGLSRPSSGTVILCALLLNLCLFAWPAELTAKTPSSAILRSKDPAFRQQFDEGLAHYQSRDFAEAEVVFRRLDVASGLSVHDREIISLLIGKCLYAEGAYLDCRKHFERYRSQNPKSVHESAVLVYLGHCSYHLREYERAAQSYVLALGIGPEEHRQIAMNNLEPLVKNGLRAKELEYLLTGLGDDDRANRLRVWIADRWLKAGRREQAQSLYQQVTENDRRSEAGRDATARLDELEHLRTEILTLGVLAPLSGDFADYGQQVTRAALMAAEEKSDQVRILIRDTRGDSARAARIADSLVHLGCRAVIGPLVPEAIRAAAKVFKKSGIVQVLPLARRGDFTTLSPCLFQMTSSPQRCGRLLAEYATEVEGMGHLAVLDSDTPDGRQAAEAFTKSATSSGAIVYPPQYFAFGQTDFGKELRALKKQAADPALNDGDEEQTSESADWIPLVDGILVWCDPEDLVLVVPQIVFHGFRVKYLGPSTWGETSELARIQSALDSVVFVSNEWVDTTRTEWQEFASDYSKRWNASPSGLSGRVYDAILWLAEDFGRSGDAESLRGILTDPAGYEGVTGHWQFDEKRQPSSTPILRHRNGIPGQVESK